MMHYSTMTKEPREEYKNRRSKAYADFSKASYPWKYIEKPALDHLISDYYKSDTIVLDIGCGNGRIMSYLIDKGVDAKNVTGLDSSSDMIKIAKSDIPDAKFVEGKAEELPFKDNTFDLITSTMMLHNLNTKEAEKMLKKIGRILSPGGQVVFIDTNPYQDPDNLQLKKWVKIMSPWGEELSVFQHDIKTLVKGSDKKFGLQLVDIYEPEIIKQGKDSSADHKKYSTKPYRIALRLQKIHA